MGKAKKQHKTAAPVTTTIPRVKSVVLTATSQVKSANLEKGRALRQRLLAERVPLAAAGASEDVLKMLDKQIASLAQLGAEEKSKTNVTKDTHMKEEKTVAPTLAKKVVSAQASTKT